MSDEKPDSLSGAQVFVLEDETLVSMMVEDMLGDLGCQVIGPFARLDTAISFINDDAPRIDVALLDVNLGKDRSFPVAEILSERGVPFVFTTGYDDASMPEEWRGRRALRKPYTMAEMALALRETIGGKS